MVNPHVAYERQKSWLKQHGVDREDQMRMLVYTVGFDRPITPTNGDPGGNVPQKFPNGATLVLGVTADCYPDGTPTNPFLTGLERFTFRAQYNANQSGLVVGEPANVGALAATVFGPFLDLFPAREIPLEANDTINATVANVTPEIIHGSISYHCLIWKQGQ